MAQSAVLTGDRVELATPSKDDRAKRRQILDGAREVFLSSGFDAASMNEIARVAGVSKGTLYVYFTSKEDLFEAQIVEEKREQAEQLCRFDEEAGDLRSELSSFGFRLLDRMLRPSSIAHLRTVAAVSAKFPRIGKAYYEAGPQVGVLRLAAYLTIHAERGNIKAKDLNVAAMHFLEMCKSNYFTRAIFGVGERPTDEILKAHVEDTVAAFLRAYGTSLVVVQQRAG